MTIEFNFTKAEFAFMREALKEKFNDLMEQLDDAEEDYDSEPVFSLNAQQVQAMKNAGVWDDPVKRMEIIQKYRNAQINELVGKEFDKQYFAWKHVTPTEDEEQPKPKKPHWTQTAKGKKIMAARKRKGQ
jgi:hypothetical protein